MIKSTLKLVAAIVLFASCNQYEKAPSGMLYKITHGSGNAKPLLQGQFVKLNIEYKLKTKDTVLSSTYGVIPVYFPIDTTRLGKYTFTEIITKCKKGDKIEFSLSIDTLVKMGAVQINEVFKSKDVILGKAEVLDVFTDVAKVDEDYKKETAAEKNREVNAIKAYLDKNKITAIQSPEGVFVVVKDPGSALSKIDTNKVASVYYKGYNFKGETFDTNIKPNDSTAKPYDVKMGTRSVIQGWEIGLQYFGKGGKGSIYVPAMLAYGPQPNGQIKAYENLAFDIVIADVTAKSSIPPPPPPPAPAKK
ncbi:MAG: FKBP-type peptidyl-prolyl cis-trans isomerase [Bacteroidetes bacterium]|nr:FKBP-type peptidyl-prolyl cis-trans isomerase [Bacteroidota bacterium]